MKPVQNSVKGTILRTLCIEKSSVTYVLTHLLQNHSLPPQAGHTFTSVYESDQQSLDLEQM